MKKRLAEHNSNEGGWHAWLLRQLTHGSHLSPARRRALYLGIMLATLMVIWLPVGLFISLLPTSYTSRWDLILPGAGTGHAVSLESVGQASATAVSPYTSNSIDPKANYKAVAQSTPVLAAAAHNVGMTLETFGKPLIKLVDQTALMHFRVSAKNAELAYCKSQALYQALQDELERLRTDELIQREAAVGQMLEGYNKKSHQTQQHILDYQASSRIVSQEQFTELTINLEHSRITLGQLNAEHAGLKGNIKALQQSLDTTPRAAAALHTLQRDALFQQLATQWSQAVAILSEKRVLWGKKHPEVVQARENHDKLRDALHQRAERLAPNTGLNPGRLVALGSSNASLYIQLVELTTQERGMAAQIASLKKNINSQTRFLEQSTTDVSALEDLKRKHQVATAVLTTALAKLDIGKSDRFSSYPLVQLLAKPTRPEKPDSLGRNLALIGGLGGTLFTFIGLLLLWKRKPYLQKLLKNI